MMIKDTNCGDMATMSGALIPTSGALGLPS